MTPLSPRTVHRRLITRVLAMSIAIAAIVGFGLWTNGKNAIGREILVGAEAGFSLLNEGIRPLLDTPRQLPAERLQRELALAMSQRRANPLGRFVWIGVYDLKGRPVASAIADVFDALTSRRPYKEPLSQEKTMAIIGEGRGTHFDPTLVDTFSAMAAGIYETYTGREDDGLRRELDTAIRRYFYAA